MMTKLRAIQAISRKDPTINPNPPTVVNVNRGGVTYPWGPGVIAEHIAPGQVFDETNAADVAFLLSTGAAVAA